MGKTLSLNLDSLWEDPYIYTEYDIGGAGHSVTINEKDKEKFLDAFAKEWRDRAEQALEENDDEEQEFDPAITCEVCKSEMERIFMGLSRCTKCGHEYDMEKEIK